MLYQLYMLIRHQIKGVLYFIQDRASSEDQEVRSTSMRTFLEKSCPKDDELRVSGMSKFERQGLEVSKKF